MSVYIQVSVKCISLSLSVFSAKNVKYKKRSSISLGGDGEGGVFNLPFANNLVRDLGRYFRAASSARFLSSSLIPVIKHYKPINNRTRVSADRGAKRQSARERLDVIIEDELFHVERARARITRCIILGALHKFD